MLEIRGMSKSEFILYIKGFKFWVERARGYALWLNILMIFDIWRTGKMEWWQAIAIGVPSLVFVLFIDYRWLFPAEAASSTQANPEWVRKWALVTELVNLVKSLTADIQALRAEIQDLKQRVPELPSVLIGEPEHGV